jgi:hypothetical protein
MEETAWCGAPQAVLLTKCYSGDLSGRMRWAEQVACMEEMRDEYRLLVGKPEGKIPLGVPRCRWKEHVKMDLHEIGCGHGLIWFRISTSGELF